MKKEIIPNYESILKNIEDSIYEELRRVQQNKGTYSDLFIKLHITEGLQKQMKSKIEEVYAVYKKISDKILQFQNYEKQSAVNAGSDEESEVYFEKKREIASEYVQLLAEFVLSEVSGRRKPGTAGGVVAVLGKDAVSQEKVKQLERKYVSKNILASISETIEIDLSTNPVQSKESEDNNLEEHVRELDPKKSSSIVHFDLKEPIKEIMPDLTKEPTQEVMPDLKESSKKELTDIRVFTQGHKDGPAEVHSDPEATTAFINTPQNAEKITSEGISTTKENKEQLAFEESAFTRKEDENELNNPLQTEEKEANKADSLEGTQNNSGEHSTSLNKQNDLDETIENQQGLIEHVQYPFIQEEQFSSGSKLLQKSQGLLNSQERMPTILKKNSFVDKEENLEAHPNHLDSSKEYLKADSQDILQATPKNDLLPVEDEGPKDRKMSLTRDNDSSLNKSRPSQALLDFLSADFASQTQKTESTNMKENYGFSTRENDQYNSRIQSEPFNTVPTLETRVERDLYGAIPSVFINTNEEAYSPLISAKVQISSGQNRLQKFSDDDHANPFRIEDPPLHLILKQRISTEEEEIRSLHNYNNGSIESQTQLPQNDTEYGLLNENDSFRFVRKSSSEEMLNLASLRPDSVNNLKNGKKQNRKPYSRVRPSYIEYLKGLPQSPTEKGTTIQKKFLQQEFKSFVGNPFAKDKSPSLYSHIIEGDLPNRIALKNNPLTNQLTTLDDRETQQDKLPAKSKMTWVAKQIFNTPNQTQHSNLKPEALNRWPKNSESSSAQNKGFMFSSTPQRQSAVFKEDLDKPIDFRKLLGIK